MAQTSDNTLILGEDFPNEYRAPAPSEQTSPVYPRDDRPNAVVDDGSAEQMYAFNELMDFLDSTRMPALSSPLKSELEKAFSAYSTESQSGQAMELPSQHAATVMGLPCPASVELLKADYYRVGYQGIIRLRVFTYGLSEESIVLLNVTSSLLEDSRSVRIRLNPAESHELEPLRLVPNIAGEHEFSFTVTIESVEGVPRGRWLGCETLDVCVEESNSLNSIQASGDVIIMGAPPLSTGTPSNAQVGSRSWKPLELQADSPFSRRLAASCPVVEPSCPTIEGQPPRNPPRLSALLTCYDQTTSEGSLLCVECRDRAQAGRGGLDKVAWWLAPDPYDEYQHSRLSRQHISIELRALRAWLKDHSTNGVVLNGSDVQHAESVLLADRDQLNLANAMPLRVRLITDQFGVHSVLLQRLDTFAERIGYLLTTGMLPVRFTVPGGGPTVWLCWRQSNGIAELCVYDRTEWFYIGPNQERTIRERFCLGWKLLETPLEQDTVVSLLKR